MRAKRSIKDSLKEYLNWCVSRLLLGGSRNDTVRDMVDAISDEIASGGGVVSQDQLDQTVQDITKSYGIADQTVLTSAEQYTDQKIADVAIGVVNEAQQATANANQAAQSANEAATNANQAAASANDAATEAHTQAEYAKTQGDYAKAEGDRVLAEKGQPGGLAELDESGRVPSSQLPSYVDDVVEYPSRSDFPATGESGKIYVATDTNLAYRWGGTEYVEISPSLALGTTAETAGRGDWTQAAYNHSLIKDGSNPHKTTFASLPDKPTSLPASDVYPWAKAASKPTYTAAEVGALPLSGGVMSARGSYPQLSMPMPTSVSGDSIFLHIGVSSDGNVKLRRYNATSDSFSELSLSNTELTAILNGVSETIYHSGNFNPENYLPLSGGSITGGLGVSGYLTAGTLRVKATSYPQISFVNTTTNRDSLLFVNGSGLYWRPTAGTETDYQVYHSGNFNPSSKASISLDAITVNNGLDGIPFNLENIAKLLVSGVQYASLLNLPDGAGNVNQLKIVGQTGQENIAFRTQFNNIWRELYHSGNLGNATTSKAGLMSAADKTKLDGLSDQIKVVGQASSTYIFPGDPSELDSSSSSTHITLILGTAIDLLDAFNNGRVFISKTVTFNEVQVPSDITYSLLKSIDPDNPTIFQIIMSTVVWGHYIEITIDFENNEYQAISNTINGIIGVNTTGTTN